MRRRMPSRALAAALTWGLARAAARKPAPARKLTSARVRAAARALALTLVLALAAVPVLASTPGAALIVAPGRAGAALPAGALVSATATQDGPPPTWPAGSGRVSLGGQSRWWPAATTADLVATDVQVVLRPGLTGLAADRSGALWLHGPWLVARVDPRTGSATQWDPSDDQAFAEVTGVRPAADRGVWLLADERLRLFDGVRFVRDLPVPAEYRAGSAITDVLDLGSEVWVSSGGGVARCVDGVWSSVAPDQLFDVRTLEVDASGSVWAAGRLEQSGYTRRTVVRFEAGQWHRSGQGGIPEAVQDLVADPTGGLLIRSRSAVGRLTSAGWRQLAGARTDVPRDLAAAPDGHIWVLDATRIRHSDRTGRWRSVAQGQVDSTVALALVDDDVWVADRRGLLRRSGTGLRRVWTADLRAPMASTHARQVAAAGPVVPAGTPLTVPADRVLVGSRELVWVSVSDYPFPFRFDGRRWQEVVLDTPAWSAPAAIASDGALWIATQEGLVRVGDDRPELVASVATPGVLYPDQGAGVWATPTSWYGWWYARGSGGQPPPGRRLIQVRPAGTRREVPLPRGVWQLSGLYPGAGDTLWATSCAGQATPARCSAPPDLDRWNGRQWSVIPYPGSAVSGVGMAKGAFWALLWRDDVPDGQTVLARYFNGAWTSFPQAGVLSRPTVTAEGIVCGGQDTNRTLVCVDETGRVTRQALEVGELLAVGPDGSVWVGAGGAAARTATRPGR